MIRQLWGTILSLKQCWEMESLTFNYLIYSGKQKECRGMVAGGGGDYRNRLVKGDKCVPRPGFPDLSERVAMRQEFNLISANNG